MPDTSDHKFVIVERNLSSFQLNMLVDLLREEGIEARGFGAISGAAVGAGEVIMGGRLEVRAGQKDEAIELVEHYKGGIEKGEFVDTPAEFTADEPLSEQKGLVLTEEEERSQRLPRMFALFFMGLFLVFLAVWATLDFFRAG